MKLSGKICLAVILFSVNICEANNTINTSVVQFNNYYRDFSAQNFSKLEAMFLENFLKHNCSNLNNYAKNPDAPDFQFKKECDGARTATAYLNQTSFDWKNMGNPKNNKEKSAINLLNEDMTTMNAELKASKNSNTSSITAQYL